MKIISRFSLKTIMMTQQKTNNIWSNVFISIFSVVAGYALSLTPKMGFKNGTTYVYIVGVLLLLGLAVGTIIILYMDRATHSKIEKEREEFGNKLSGQLDSLNKIQDDIGNLTKARAISIDFFSHKRSFSKEIEVSKIEKYFESIMKFVLESKDHMTFFDYIGDHNYLTRLMNKDKKGNDNFEDEFKIIKKKGEEYFQTIYDHLTSSMGNIHYHRIFMLPLIHVDKNNENKVQEYMEANFGELTIKDIMSEGAYQHICKMLSLKEKDGALKGRVHIKILPFSISNHSYAIIDNKKLIIQLAFYNINSYPLPNQIFAIHDDVDGTIVKPYREYFNIYNDLADNIEDVRFFDMKIKDYVMKSIKWRKFQIENKDF